MNIDAYAPNIIMTQWLSQKLFRWLPFPQTTSFSKADWDQALNWESQEWTKFATAALRQPDEEWAWRTVLSRHWSGSAWAPQLAGAGLQHWPAFQAIAYADPAYPSALRHIPDPPAVLFTQGNVELLSRPMIALIGSRKASYWALEQGQILAAGLARHGLVVVSGGAIGCDSAAHWGVAKSGLAEMPAAVVFAGGVDCPYPRLNSRLFDQLLAGGGVFVSERLPGSVSRPLDFPIRNRIIAGMSQHLVILQAGIKSGAMSTARLALEQGRELWVLAHPDGDVRADGSHALIRDGASSFASAEALLTLWGLS